MGGDVGAGQVDDASQAFEGLGISDGRFGGGVPLELIGPLRRAAHQLQNGQRAGGKGLTQRCAQQAGGAGDEIVRTGGLRRGHLHGTCGLVP